MFKPWLLPFRKRQDWVQALQAELDAYKAGVEAGVRFLGTSEQIAREVARVRIVVNHLVGDLGYSEVCADARAPAHVHEHSPYPPVPPQVRFWERDLEMAIDRMKTVLI